MIINEEHIGGQRLILADCLKVMPTLGEFYCVVTDPPYLLESGATLVACENLGRMGTGIEQGDLL